jgi:hypothetical protein
VSNVIDSGPAFDIRITSPEGEEASIEFMPTCRLVPWKRSSWKDLAIPVIKAFSRTYPEGAGGIHEQVGDIRGAKAVGSSKFTEVAAVITEEAVLRAHPQIPAAILGQRSDRRVPKSVPLVKKPGLQTLARRYTHEEGSKRNRDWPGASKNTKSVSIGNWVNEPRSPQRAGRALTIRARVETSTWLSFLQVIIGVNTDSSTAFNGNLH